MTQLLYPVVPSAWKGAVRTKRNHSDASEALSTASGHPRVDGHYPHAHRGLQKAPPLSGELAEAVSMLQPIILAIGGPAVLQVSGNTFLLLQQRLLK